MSQNDLRRRERRVEDLRRDLHREPFTVLADFPAQWPYTVQFYRMTGTADVGIQVTHPATGAVALHHAGAVDVLADDDEIPTARGVTHESPPV